MSKKKKLNSKNPKYHDKSQVNEPTILTTRNGSAKIRNGSGKLTGDTIKVRAIYYEQT